MAWARIFYPGLTPASAEGLAICAGFGLLVWLLHAATPLAAVTGFLLTSCLYVTSVDQPRGGWFHTALVPGLALFVLAFAATRFRRAQKEQTGLAESRRGRGASQIAANMGVAALAALALPRLFSSVGFTGSSPISLCATWSMRPMIAALAEAAADTVSSEIGQAAGGKPVLISNLRRVPLGDRRRHQPHWHQRRSRRRSRCRARREYPRFVSIPQQAAVAWLAAIFGLFADSLIGATLERRGWLNNDSVNFISTALAALIALAAELKLHP